MARVEMTTTIERQPDEVFAYVTDFDRASVWQDGLLEARATPNGPLHIGTRITEVRRLMGRRQEFVGEVVAYDAARRTYTGRTLSGPFPAQGRWTVEPAGSGARVSILEEAHLGGWMRLLDPLIARMFRNALGTSLANLKRVMETQPAGSQAAPSPG